MRAAVDQVARVSGVLGRRERARGQGLTVLTYHRVLEAERARAYPFPSLVLPLEAFTAQVHWLAQRHEVLPLAEALQANRAVQARRRPLLAFSFDDGYAEAGGAIADVLEGAGVRGTFFVTTGFVGTREHLWFDAAALCFDALPASRRREIVLEVCGAAHAARLPDAGSGAGAWASSLKRCRPLERQAVLAALVEALGGAPPIEGYQSLSLRELGELHARGHEIGSHTVTHPLLPELDDERLQAEVQGAADSLQLWLGVRASGFCYPNGDCDGRVLASVARAGHDYAVTTRDGIHRPGDDPLQIPRVDIVAERSLSAAGTFAATALRREVCGLYRDSLWRAARGGEHA